MPKIKKKKSELASEHILVRPKTKKDIFKKAKEYGLAVADLLEIAVEGFEGEK